MRPAVEALKTYKQRGLRLTLAFFHSKKYL